MKATETGKFKTESGIELEPLYSKENTSIDEERIGEPGQYPYTRGIYKSMYTKRPWTMRQYSGFGTAEESNERYRFLLDQGQTGLSVALDLPTQLGYDSDHPMVEEEVGRVGVAIDSIKDMEILFHNIPLDKISTSFTINSTAAILLAMYAVVAERQGVPWRKITGTTQNDILKEYVARGTWIFPPEPSVRLIVDTLEWSMNEAPRFKPISIAGAHFRDAGASAVQELAYTLADGITYVQAALDRGLDVDKFGPSLSFFFYTHTEFFEEIAKYRAGRRIWANLMKERFGAKDPKTMMFKFGTVCGGSSLTAQQPLNNTVRVSFEALAAVLGGVQSVFTCAWDEAFTIPSESTAELALRTQQIILDETGVSKTVDPLGGSYFVEELTNKVEEEALKIINKIEGLGGMIPAIERGIIQSEISKRAYEVQRNIESGEKTIIGVNKFARKDEKIETEIYQPDPNILQRQLNRLKELKLERSNSEVNKAISALKRGAEGNVNLMPLLIDAVRVGATVGEMTGAMREIFGEFNEPKTF
ncbi:methylmalonyl-CoA mutase [Anaerobacillus sp. MEB173]|uniref:acyl-CoA mutase large subunit family protein n=1 Tax=Anaerobacillus sp. MEB173 TaxID=3383345 RepID=UPI003F8E0472